MRVLGAWPLRQVRARKHRAALGVAEAVPLRRTRVIRSVVAGLLDLRTGYPSRAGAGRGRLGGMQGILRLPAVTGRFYPAGERELGAEVDRLMGPGPPQPCLGVIVPHAGYRFSGPTAGIVFGCIQVPDVAVILSPNHTGLGAAFSVHPGGLWRTPIGDVSADPGLANALLALDSDLEPDTHAHAQEHGIEVELPFLLRRNPAIRIVAVVLGVQDPAAMQRLGAALAAFARNHAPGALLVASSDMNHFENLAITRSKDRRALDRVLALDAPGLDAVCRSDSISMCGRGPAAAVITAARFLGAGRAELLDYRTSADAGGDADSVVGYAGVRIAP